MSDFVLSARSPFDFAATARFLRFSEAELVDTFNAGRYRRALHFGEQLLLLSVGEAKTPEARRPALTVRLAPAAFVTAQIRTEAARVVCDMFSLEHDLAEWHAHLTHDPLMRRLEAASQGLHLARWPTLCEALTTCIMMQQIATSVAIALRRRLVESFGARLVVDGQTFYAFPRAEALARARVEELRALGLSNAKATCIIETSRACASGELDQTTLGHEDNETITRRLVALRGIGRWTAEWALMLYFGRTDVFPAADLFLRGVIVKYYHGGATLHEREIRAFAAQRWGTSQSYAALYFLAGMRAGSITLKPERVLSSARDRSAASPTPRARK